MFSVSWDLLATNNCAYEFARILHRDVMHARAPTLGGQKWHRDLQIHEIDSGIISPCKHAKNMVIGFDFFEEETTGSGEDLR